MLNENNPEPKYIIKVNGQPRTAPLPRTLAENAIQQLPENERSLAQIVPVAQDGKEILLG